MIDREPVDIMGVTAFPNPNKDERVIRFIDSEYHTLFTIKDGESIVITRFDGEKMILSCAYIDDYQFYIYCYQRKPFEKAQKEQQKNDRLAVKKRAEPER